MPPDVRKWFYYPIEMPVTAAGVGPATVGKDAARITYEVWDVLLNTHGAFETLPDAINEAMRLNAEMSSTPSDNLAALQAENERLRRAVEQYRNDMVYPSSYASRARRIAQLNQLLGDK